MSEMAPEGHAEVTRTARRNVGTCPACRNYLWGEVTLVATVGKPDFSRDGTPETPCYTQAVAMTLSHTCDSRVMPEWEAELLGRDEFTNQETA